MYGKNRVGEGVLVHVLGCLEEDGPVPDALLGGDSRCPRGSYRHVPRALRLAQRGLGPPHLRPELPRQLKLGVQPALEEAYYRVSERHFFLSCFYYFLLLACVYLSGVDVAFLLSFCLLKLSFSFF